MGRRGRFPRAKPFEIFRIGCVKRAPKSKPPLPYFGVDGWYGLANTNAWEMPWPTPRKEAIKSAAGRRLG